MIVMPLAEAAAHGTHFAAAHEAGLLLYVDTTGSALPTFCMDRQCVIWSG